MVFCYQIQRHFIVVSWEYPVIAARNNATTVYGKELVRHLRRSETGDCRWGQPPSVCTYV